jgi:hypothetical protein
MKSSPKTGGLFRSGKQHPRWLGSKQPELKGAVFGSVTITSSLIHRVNGSAYVTARCSLSGVTKLVYLNNLKNGKTTSFFKNGRRPTLHAEVLGRRYDAIVARCTKPTNPEWKHYGGRGIKCLFETRMSFIQWVSNHLPHETYKGVEIDREDNDGHYEPGNLRLATRKQQMANRRNTVWVQTPTGPVLLNEWPSPLGRGATYKYVKMGLTSEQIVEQARNSVARRRKNWQGIASKLASMT